jgi:hypothetical protein
MNIENIKIKTREHSRVGTKFMSIKEKEQKLMAYKEFAQLFRGSGPMTAYFLTGK